MLPHTPNAMVRLALKEIIEDNESSPRTKRISTTRKLSGAGEDLQKLQLKEGVCFLERKVEMQNAEVKVLSEQLRNEITLKQQLLSALEQERERSKRAMILLNNANKHVSELKKKVSAAEEKHIRNNYDMKMEKYREIVRRKDELITKSQQRIDELSKHESELNVVAVELKYLKESYGKLKIKDEQLSLENERLSRKCRQASEQLIDLEAKHAGCEQQREKLTSQYNQLSEMYNSQQCETKYVEEEMRGLLDLQMRTISQLREEQRDRQMKEKARQQEAVKTPLEPLNVQIYRNEMKRVLSSVVVDSHLRRKIEKEVLRVLRQVEQSYSKILVQAVAH